MKLLTTTMMVGLAFSSLSCTKSDKKEVAKSSVVKELKTYPISKLPKDIVWETNDKEPTYASPDAKKGGTFRTFLLSFPVTFRTVGPDSNGSFRSAILGNQMGLVGIHPNTDAIVPELATHWAYGKDGKTIYYKINPKARWSDGKMVTADDFMFGLEFMRSKHIVAPWYNKHYGEEIVEMKKYDDHTISISGKTKKPKNELHYYYGVSPRPRHFHNLNKNWVKNYNWKVEPNTGAYQISEVKKGKFITFKRKTDWWAKDLRLNKGRFNVDKVIYKVIRDQNVAWEYFKKGEIDTFNLVLPEYWHNKSKTSEFANGYIHKMFFFQDKPQADYGIWLNTDKEIFKDINVRYAFAYAMNVEKVLKDVLRGDYFRLNTGTTGYAGYENKSIKARPYDRAKVAALMEKSGWKRGGDGIWTKDGKRFSVKVMYGSAHHTDRLVVLKEEAKKAGVEIILDQKDPSSAFQAMLKKEHQAAWSGWGAQYRPQYWGQYHSDNAHKPQTNNFANADDKILDDLIVKFKNSLEDSERKDYAKKIQQRIYDLGFYIPTFLVPYTRVGYWRWMKLPKIPGTKTADELFEPFGSAIFWIDTDVKKETLAAKKAGKKFPPVTIIDKTYKTF